MEPTFFENAVNYLANELEFSNFINQILCSEVPED